MLPKLMTPRAAMTTTESSTAVGSMLAEVLRRARKRGERSKRGKERHTHARVRVS
jgi:hypothetical protein